LLAVCNPIHATTHAQPLPRPALHWTRAADAGSCIDPRQLALRVTALTGPVLVAASAADLSIEGHVTRLANGSFRARVTATARDGTQRGERALEQDRDCRKLDQALAFVIALLIDPDLVLQQLPAGLVGLGAEGNAPETALLAELDARPPVPVRPTPAARVETKPAPVAPPKPPPSDQLSLAAGPSFGLNELPRPTLGAVASGALLVRSWFALELALRAGFMIGAHRVDGRSVRAQSYAASLLACPRYPGARLIADLCVGPELALLRARGAGFTSDHTAHVTTASARLGAGVALRLTAAWFLQLRAFGRVAFNRPAFTYSTLASSQRAFSIQRLSANAELMVGYAF
jgi:hypothetical protein